MRTTMAWVIMFIQKPKADICKLTSTTLTFSFIYIKGVWLLMFECARYMTERKLYSIYCQNILVLWILYKKINDSCINAYNLSM